MPRVKNKMKQIVTASIINKQIEKVVIFRLRTDAGHNKLKQKLQIGDLDECQKCNTQTAAFFTYIQARI